MTVDTISPLRRRMTFLRPPKRASRRRVEDMTIRGLAPKTQTGYIRVIQVLLGHKKLDSTARYSDIASTILRAAKSLRGHLSPITDYGDSAII